MPYIGNNHIAGDHTNNFKVLDDISSFTATFDGSASSVIDTTNNTIRVVEHRFIQGQRVTYTNGGGGNIGGLTTGTAYFVIFDSASTIKLATSASNAANSTAINLSAVGTGSSHTLNVAFDGVNKKFKLTHSSGTDARLNNASQINIAINNVVQRPNLDPNNFTDGFALEDNHKIVFQTAPTVNDIFWGSIIANTLTTFDISDHKIDTFTGDGSTTEFTLSHTPANNESLMVTINGVLQHPSNASTARAYTLIASIIQFTAAPANGDEIQVRHLGFAGATTADVSGFYGRTGNVVLTDQDDITVNKINVGTGVTIESNGQATFVGVVTFGSGSTTIDNNVVNVGTALTLGHTQGLQFHTQNLHSAGFEVNQINTSGIITASSLDISGNASIGGILTYEDVTSIDSVGIITARDGIDCNGDIDVDGHTNLDNVSVSGITTFSGIIDAVNTPASIRVAQDIQHKGDADTKLLFGTNTIDLQTAGSTRLRAENSGVVITGVTTVSASAHISNANGSVFFGSGSATAYGSQGGIGRASNANYHISSSAVGDLCIAAEGDKRILFGTKTGTGIGGITKRMSIASSGTVTIDGNLDAVGGIDATANSTFAGDIDVDGHANLDDVNITGDLAISDTIKHIGDNNTKIRFPANDEISFDTSGHDRIYIKSDGKIGMGTVTPANDIHHFSDGANGNSFRLENREGYITFVNDADGLYIDAGYLNFRNRAGSTTYASINTNGNLSVFYDLDVDGHTNLDNVSIAGVTTCTGLLTANGEILMTGSGTILELQAHGGPSIGLKDTNGNSFAFVSQVGGTFRVATSGNSYSPKLTITPSGNVGIEEGNLDVFNGSNSSTIKLKRHASTASEQAHIGYFSSGLHIETREATYISLKTNTNERLRIDSVGRILIAKGDPDTTTSQIQIGDGTTGYSWDNGDVPQVLIAGVNNESPSSGTLNIALRVADENNNNMFQIHNRGGGNSDVGQVYVAGKLGVGTNNPVQALSVFGNIYQRQGDYITWNNGDCQIGGVSGYHIMMSTYTGSSMKDRLQVHGGSQHSPVYVRDSFNEFKPVINTTGHVAHPDYSTNTKTNLSAGWYTIAVNGGNRASARFNVIDRAGSRHQSFTFYASHHYGGARAQNAINVTHGGGRHSANPIRGLRIRANGTYDGAMLQVYLGDSSNFVTASLAGDNMNTNGWIMKDWIADGTDPGNLNNWSSINSNGGTAAYADLTQINGGGMSCHGNFVPGFDNSDANLGTSSRRWVRVYAGDSSINTSDENLKQNITTLTTAEMNAAKRLSKLFVTYKWKKSVSEKGDKARTHTGIIAQRVKAEMIAAGLDPTKYSFYCEDTKYTMPDGTDVDLIDENVTDDEVVDDNHVPSYVQPAGSTKSTTYSICYTELLAFIAAYNEQRFTSIESRLATLESS